MITTFIKVEYDLVSTTKLHSTQKLFIAYVIGWQRNDLTCRETNNALAKKFGMKYSGIRTLIRGLNKFEFFQAIAYDYNQSNNTSGHEITVDETKLNNFLKGIESAPVIQKVKEDTINTEHEIKVASNNSSMDEVESDLPNSSDASDDVFDLVLNSEKDIAINNKIIEEYYLKYGIPTEFIKAKIVFEDENDFFIKDVFELKDIKHKCRYVVKGDFDMFLKDYKPIEVDE
jgi:predicted transcriptional regulator